MAAEDPGESLPEFVFVPARAGVGGPEMETRYTADETELALPAFSTIARLVAVLGRDQAWVCARLKDVRETAAAAGLSAVVIDPEVIP